EGRAAVAHCVHPEDFFHPIASSGLPLHLFCNFIFTQRKNHTPLTEVILAIDCTQTQALDKYEMRFRAIYFAE
ncbi:MAG TPA: hypothetical protein VMQ76_05810, partial [Terracidiphilus sp.]|nr:hypothetical protein [Terracidiphilus sp.]